MDDSIHDNFRKFALPIFAIAAMLYFYFSPYEVPLVVYGIFIFLIALSVLVMYSSGKHPYQGHYLTNNALVVEYYPDKKLTIPFDKVTKVEHVKLFTFVSPLDKFVYMRRRLNSGVSNVGIWTDLKGFFGLQKYFYLLKDDNPEMFVKDFKSRIQK